MKESKALLFASIFCLIASNAYSIPENDAEKGLFPGACTATECPLMGTGIDACSGANPPPPCLNYNPDAKPDPAIIPVGDMEKGDAWTLGPQGVSGGVTGSDGKLVDDRAVKAAQKYPKASTPPKEPENDGSAAINELKEDAVKGADYWETFNNTDELLASADVPAGKKGSRAAIDQIMETRDIGKKIARGGDAQEPQGNPSLDELYDKRRQPTSPPAGP